MTPPLVLALDTATDVATLALLRSQGGTFEQVSGRTVPSSRSHTHALLGTVEECLAEAAAGPSHIGAVVVGIGPGTFTGVRIAVATARALALSLSIPVVGVPSLTALASGVLDDDLSPEVGALVGLVDARRGQVFGAVYRRQEGDGLSTWARVGELFVTEPERALEAALAEGAEAPDETLFVGAVGGVPGKTAALALQARHLVRGQDRLLEPLTKVRGLETWLSLQLEQPLEWAGVPPGSLGTPEAVDPLYVRAPDADLHITKMRDPWTG